MIVAAVVAFLVGYAAISSLLPYLAHHSMNCSSSIASSSAVPFSPGGDGSDQWGGLMAKVFEEIDVRCERSSRRSRCLVRTAPSGGEAT